MTRAARRTLVASALALVASLAPAAGQDGDPTTARRRELAARVARVRGGATVQGPEEKQPGALAEGRTLRAGDRVRAGKEPVELVFPRGERDDRSVDGGDRLVLGPGARATVAPIETAADVRLDEGAAWASAAGDLRVQTGRGVVVVRGGDAEVEVAKDGDVKVTVHAGKADVETAGGATPLATGERVDVDARGARVRRAQPKRPAWVDAHERLEPTALVYAETFAAWPSPYRPPGKQPIGDAWGDKLRGQEFVTSTRRHLDELAHWWSEVRFGIGSEQGGLFTVEPGTRIRVRYRLSREVPVFLRIARKFTDPKFESTRLRGRAGVWTDVDFRPEHFATPTPTDEVKTFGAPSVLTYLSFCAGDPDVPAHEGVVLDVQRVVAWR